jgi:hypothetical protein
MGCPSVRLIGGIRPRPAASHWRPTASRAELTSARRLSGRIAAHCGGMGGVGGGTTPFFRRRPGGGPNTMDEGGVRARARRSFKAK